MLFTSGYELEKFRKLARQKLARTNPLYADPNISIYAPIMENVSTGDPNRYKEIKALRRNPAGWLIDGAFRYTLQFEEQRLDEDSGMAGLPGVSERDQ